MPQIACLGHQTRLLQAQDDVIGHSPCTGSHLPPALFKTCAIAYWGEDYALSFNAFLLYKDALLRQHFTFYTILSLEKSIRPGIMDTVRRNPNFIHTAVRLSFIGSDVQEEIE